MTANNRLQTVRESYGLTRTDGGRSRNTEFFTFDGDVIARVEVYFGWDLG
jgi:hypothetical protein